MLLDENRCTRDKVNEQVLECPVFTILGYKVKILNKGIYRFLRCLFSFIQKHLLHSGVVSCHVLAVNAALTSVYEEISRFERTVVTMVYSTLM